MARADEYTFSVTDVATMENQILAEYERLTGRSVAPASLERLLIQWLVSILVNERILCNYIGNQNIPSRAEGRNLDALGELFHLGSRPEAQPAECVERFFLSEPQVTAVSIPKGTRVKDADGLLVWETTQNAFVPIGETYVDIPVQCQTAGIVGNGYAPGQLSKLVDLFDYYSRCENITASDSGSDRATDEEYYNLMRLSMDSYSCAGAKGSYVYFAKQVSTEIADVVANSPQPGYVHIFVLMNDGSIASETVKKAVLEACSADTVRPLTDYVSVCDPELVTYNIDLTYYIADNLGNTPTTISAAVADAVQQYISWQSAKMGRDINPSQLIGLIMQTGVKRCDVSEPSYVALRSGLDDRVPQVAALGTLTITYGGIESE